MRCILSHRGDCHDFPDPRRLIHSVRLNPDILPLDYAPETFESEVDGAVGIEPTSSGLLLCTLIGPAWQCSTWSE